MSHQTSIVQATMRSVLILFAITAVPFFFLGQYLIGEVNHQQASRSLDERASLVFQLLENDINNKLNNLQHSTNVFKAKDFSKISRNDVEFISNEFSGVVWAGLAGLDGTVLFSTQGILEGVNVMARPWFKAGQSAASILDKHDALLLASKLPPRADPYKFIDIAVPVHARDGALAGVLALHLDWTWYQKQFPDLLGREPSVSMISSIITGKDGELRLAKLGLKQTDQDLNRVLQEINQTGALSSHQFLISTFKPPAGSKLASLGWTIHLVRPEQSIAQQTISAVSLSIAGLLLGMVIISCFMVITARKISSKVVHHLDAVEHLSPEEADKSEKTLPSELAPLMAHIRDLFTRVRFKAQKLREQLERAQLSFMEINTLIQQAPVSIAMFDRDMKYLACSALWSQQYFKGGVDPIGVSHYDLVPNIPDAWRAFHLRGMRGESIHKEDDVWEDQEGQKHWINWIIEPWLGKDGGVQGIIIITEDVSEAHRAKDALAASEERFQLAMEGAADGIYDWKVKEEQVYLSPGWKAMLGYTPNELENSIGTWESLLHPDDLEPSRDYLNKRLADPEAFTWLMSFRLAHKNGAWVNILSRGKIIRNAGGDAIRVIGTHLDRTEVDRLQSELEQAWGTAQAEAQSNDAKSRFLATVSHEIRNPMNAISGFARLIADDSKDVQVSRYANLLNQTTESLKLILNDILDFAKIDAGKLEIINSTFNFSELIDGLAEATRLQCNEKGVAFELRKQLPVNFYVGDAGRIRQVAQNLLSNAIKFTSAGSVCLRVSASPVDSTRDNFVIEVRDSGLGIPHDKLHRLFTPFSQLHSDSSTKFGGTGLGLTIVKSLTEAMDGVVECESVEGGGSVFRVSLQLRRGHEFTPAQHLPSCSIQSRRILIADDMPVNLHIMKAFLSKRGHVVTTADSGGSALNLLEHTKFDYVLLDIDMADMSGHEVVKRIRSGDGVNCGTPFACVTGHTMDEAVGVAMAAGFDQFFSKPVDFDLLASTLSQELLV